MTWYTPQGIAQIDDYPWGVHRLSDMIGHSSVTTIVDTYGQVRAVPLPYRDGLFERLRTAWFVLIGAAHAVRWPEPGDLEKALDR